MMLLVLQFPGAVCNGIPFNALISSLLIKLQHLQFPCDRQGIVMPDFFPRAIVIIREITSVYRMWMCYNCIDYFPAVSKAAEEFYELSSFEFSLNFFSHLASRQRNFMISATAE